MSIDIDESRRTAQPGPAFPNGSAYADWRGRWCENCRNDAGYREKDNDSPVREAYAGGCPLLVIAIAGDQTPAEWLPQESGSDAYHCIMFRSDEGDGGGEEPQPQPEPDQDGLFDRPERRVRMLVQPQRSVVAA